MEQMRSEFEAWWHSAERGLVIINFGVQRELQWAAWQASRAAIEIEPVERYSVDCFENFEQDDEGYLVYYDSVINAIRAAGLRVKESK